MKITVTKQFHFCYSHTLPDHKGKCKRLHGHNALLNVTVGTKQELQANDVIEGVNKSTYPGMVIDFGDMKEFVNRSIVDLLDHNYLNDILPEIFLPPTAENIAKWIWRELNKWSNSFPLVAIRLYETPDSYVEITK